MPREHDYVEVCGVYQNQTDKAVCLYIEDCGEDRWIPKSVIRDWSDSDQLERGDEIEIEVQEWFAVKEGLD